MNAGYDVKVSEVHGMSQRGGSVVTYVRFGDKVYSPIIDKGEADFIVSFELLEAARWLEYLKTGRVVTNTQQMEPMPVIAGLATCPENLVEKMQARGHPGGCHGLPLSGGGGGLFQGGEYGSNGPSLPLFPQHRPGGLAGLSGGQCACQGVGH